MKIPDSFTLSDYTVLITRPEGQGDNLCQLIESAGGKAVSFPVIRTAITDNVEKCLIQFKSLTDFSHFIFVSRNSVIYIQKLVVDIFDQLRNDNIYAVGAGTAEELKKCGVDKVFYSEGNSGSEALLDHEGLQQTEVQGSNILIVRGNGGRELLKETLGKRGASIHYTEVYKRLKLDVQPDAISYIWHEVQPQVIVVTSVEGLDNLVEMTAEQDIKRLFDTRLVVISPRLLPQAQSLGFTSNPVVAGEQSDLGLLKAILQSVNEKDIGH